MRRIVMKTCRLLAVALTAGVPLAGPVAARPAAQAAGNGPLEITSSMMVEQRSAAADGTTRVALVKPTGVSPGDRIIFVTAYHNVGTQPLTDVVLANPLPRAIAYRSASPGSPAPEVSVDGKTFGALASLRVRALDGSTRAAGPDDVTHVRWRIARPLAPGSQGQFAFQAVLK
jgi:uncharacterized repeat protein (TIGR01451 family)